MLNLLRSRLSPFRHSNYRRFFIVQTVSLVGTWSHDLARAWLVLELMNKAGALGGIMLASAIPSLFLILRSGVLVDRLNPKKLMILTKSILMVSSLALAYLVEFTDIHYWQLILFAILEGIVGSLDFPSYQAMAVRIIPRKDFQQAIALNSTNFHLARALGPLVAGGLMTWHGPSVVFLLDGISYGVLAFVLTKINLLPKMEDREEEEGLSQSPSSELSQSQSTATGPIQRPIPTQNQSPTNQPFREGLRYLFKTPKLRYRLFQFFLSVSLLFPVGITVFRAFLRLKFNLNSETFGLVFSAPAFGSMAGALCLTALKPKRPMQVLKFAIPGIFLTYITLTQINSITVLWPTMVFSGFCSFLIFAAVTMSLHLEVDDRFRGRMASFMGLGWLSIGPLMSFPVGGFSDIVGYENAIIIAAGVFVSGSALLFVRHKQSKLRV